VAHFSHTSTKKGQSKAHNQMRCKKKGYTLPEDVEARVVKGDTNTWTEFEVVFLPLVVTN
jgi:hypothetical protein